MVTSSLPGGPADKGGTNYEILWGLHAMMEVVQGQAESITIEEPGVDGAEFYLFHQGRKEHWQTKRQIMSQENWSLQKLETIGVLDFFRRCAAAGERAVFASISDAPALRILSNHAQNAKTFEQFMAKFLPGDRERDFAALRKHLGKVSEQEAFDFLLKVNIHTANEDALEERFLHSTLIALFSDPAASTQANLSWIYLNNVHQTLTRDQILTELEKRGIHLRVVADSPTIRVQLQAYTNEYVSGQKAKLIARTPIPRKAASDATERISRATNSLDLLISSAAGGGKSGCFHQMATELIAAGVPLLAFRLDRLEPTLGTVALGKQMGLTESPALVLARAYPRQAVVLLIDQLDFVSAASGRHPDFFDALAALVEEVRGLRSAQVIHLVLACREFDYEHDHRFRSLLPKDEKPIKLDPFTPDEVKEVIKREGGDPNRLQPRQLQLLTLAQNLALFMDSKLVHENKPSFITQKQLFDAYWDAKKKEAEKMHPEAAAQWADLIKKLTDEMSRRQQVSVPKAFLDRYPKLFVDYLVASGVLTTNGRAYGFGHESFFDYCFARSAVASPVEFSAFLETDDQLLFRRAQLRQVLVYLRDDDPPRYLSNLSRVLDSPKIRPHLKLLALELVAAIPDPTDEEFLLLRPALDSELSHRRAKTSNPNKIFSRTWDVFFASRTLFPVADRLGLVSGWLNSSDSWLNNLAIAYLRWQLLQHADRVTELVLPFEFNHDWHPRFCSLVERGHLEKSRRFFDFVIRLLDRGVLDRAKAPFHSSGGFWTTVNGLAEAQPTWAAELAAHWLDRQVARSTEPGIAMLDDDSGIDDLDEAAKKAPTAILEHVLPAVLRAAEKMPCDFKNEGLPWDRAWSGRPRTDDLDLSEAYLQAITTAFASISANSPEALRWSIELLKKSEFDTANQLLFAAYRCHPQHFADEALTLLTSDSRRFFCSLHGSSYWLARGLIEACSPHCSETVFRKIESTILAFVPEDERTGDGYKIRGLAAFTLASVLDPSRTVDTTKTKLIEWSGKLGEPDGPPDVIRAYSVVSPITEEEASRMSDDQWLRAMKKYHKKSRDPANFMKGTAPELAGMLGTFVAKAPARFAALAHKFPPEPEPHYLSAVLSNLRRASIPAADKIAVARLAFNWPPENAAWSALEVLGSIEDLPLPADALAYICNLAFNGPGPTGGRRRITASNGKEKAHDIRIDATNCVRGRAIEAMALLVFDNRSYLDFFAPDIERLTQDPLPSIRACTAFAVYAIASHDPNRALALLPNFFDTDIALQSSEYVVRLIKHGLPKHLATLKPFVEQLLTSKNPEARRHGGIAACLARLYHPTETELAEKAIAGSVEARRGAAAVAEGNLLDAKHRAWCEETLIRLFSDTDEEVRDATAHCFWQLWRKPHIPLTDYSALIEAFLQSPAFTTDPSFLLHALEDTKARIPDQVLHICETFVQRCADEARDISTGIAGDEHTVGKLVFRAIAQLSNHEVQLRAVAVIDGMCLEGLDSAAKHLGDFER